MPAPTVTAASFVDNAVPYGSRYEDFKTGTQASPTDIAYYLLENITIARAGNVTYRPDPVGGPNGFVLVNGQDTMSAKAQLATNATTTLKRGNWFKDTFDPSDGTTAIGLPSSGSPTHTEVWVIINSSDKFEMNGYWYQDLSLARATSAP